MTDVSALLIEAIQRLAKIEQVCEDNRKKLDALEKENQAMKQQLLLIKQDPIMALFKKVVTTGIVVAVTVYVTSLIKK